ncbi:MAG TPA: metalloregulator ArsR/SmtB family transcription factor [Candidatus Paceibacterota bacterium]
MNDAGIEHLLKPLANRRRLAILNFLRARKEAHVGQIAEFVRLSLPATSRHLTMLERVGFLEKDQRSLNVYYRISKGASPILTSVFDLY